MKEEIQYILACQDNLKEAHTISEWTVEAGTMLPQQPNILLGIFAQGRAFLARSMPTSVLVGHAAITTEYPDRSLELGAVVVHPEWRHKGIALGLVTNLVEHIKTQSPEAVVFALANNQSLGLFLRLGGQVMANAESLHPDVWALCSGCPHFKGHQGQCCDTPVDLSPIISSRPSS